MTRKVDVLIVGAGPGGYPAAIRAAQKGKSVLVVDRGYLGGECLHWGCIPSKALISAANQYYSLEKIKVMGINVEKASIDMKALQEWKKSVQNKLIGGIRQLFKGNGVEYAEGSASFVTPTMVEIIKNKGGKELIEAENIILATGADFKSLTGFDIDEKQILSPKGALALNEIPESLIIVGGGVTGLELGTLFAKLGSRVSIVELMPEILADIEKGLVRMISTNLRKLGVQVYKESKATSLHQLNNGTMKLEIETKKGKETLIANKVLVTIGKQGNVVSLHLDRAGVQTDKSGFIKINNQCRSNVSNIFAIGDCTGPPFQAHRATKQGIVAAEVIAGESAETDFRSVPRVIFTDPEIAFTGLSEKDAKEAGIEVKTARVMWGASGRALTHLSELGYVKVIADAKNDAIIGIEIVGPNATDLISEASLALEMGATLEDLGYTMHPHPTLPETLMEASEAALNRAIHVIPRKSKKKS
ncbi:MAG: dihydrolipoyl dehydrogenase [Candidatus Hodarchaeota archaeon]